MNLKQVVKAVDSDVTVAVTLDDLGRFLLLLDEGDEEAIFRRAYEVQTHRAMAFSVVDLTDHQEAARSQLLPAAHTKMMILLASVADLAVFMEPFVDHYWVRDVGVSVVRARPVPSGSGGLDEALGDLLTGLPSRVKKKHEKEAMKMYRGLVSNRYFQDYRGIVYLTEEVEKLDLDWSLKSPTLQEPPVADSFLPVTLHYVGHGRAPLNDFVEAVNEGRKVPLDLKGFDHQLFLFDQKGGADVLRWPIEVPTRFPLVFAEIELQASQGEYLGRGFPVRGVPRLFYMVAHPLDLGDLVQFVGEGWLTLDIGIVPGSRAAEIDPNFTLALDDLWRHTEDRSMLSTHGMPDLPRAEPYLIKDIVRYRALVQEVYVLTFAGVIYLEDDLASLSLNWFLKDSTEIVEDDEPELSGDEVTLELQRLKAEGYTLDDIMEHPEVADLDRLSPEDLWPLLKTVWDGEI